MKKGLVTLILLFLLVGNSLAAKEFSVPYPPFSPGIFPCMACHEGMDRNRNKRQLADMHQEIKIIQHGERWCYDCHDARNMDRLRLVNGKQIKFEESYNLCGQCHGNILRDWKKGIHGKRTGNWQGEKQYLLCVHCHDPHNPPFKPVRPEPAPVKPEKTLLKRKSTSK